MTDFVIYRGATKTFYINWRQPGGILPIDLKTGVPELFEAHNKLIGNLVPSVHDAVNGSIRCRLEWAPEIPDGRLPFRVRINVDGNWLSTPEMFMVVQ
jgi:hypothetical protein